MQKTRQSTKSYISSKGGLAEQRVKAYLQTIIFFQINFSLIDIILGIHYISMLFLPFWSMFHSHCSKKNFSKKRSIFRYSVKFSALSFSFWSDKSGLYLKSVIIFNLVGIPCRIDCRRSSCSDIAQCKCIA